MRHENFQPSMKSACLTGKFFCPRQSDTVFVEPCSCSVFFFPLCLVQGTSVVQVTAYDGDLSLAAPVTYLIDEGEINTTVTPNDVAYAGQPLVHHILLEPTS